VIKFHQSSNDFPLTVALGGKVPTWDIKRWERNSGLRFIPPDDDGYTLRGDKQQLVYKGRRRSHRFTILGDNAFEYDCILEREPESNVVALRMEGAENFDFFRQPDFLTDPLLAGSYAVYKKETMLGEGTGKLCHIYRPEIIDARGRRCWGNLSVVGNSLCITVPEKWLSEAAYPVIVDPTIGTTTVGSQTHWNNVDNESIDQLFLELAIMVNRFQLPETLNGSATAYVYAYDNDYYGRCKPVIYSDNNNFPQTRRSASEGDFDIEVRNGKPASWRSTTFSTNTSIASGSYVWFSLFSDWFAPRFDYGAKCYWDFWDHLGNNIPNTYPAWSVNWFYNFKISMYFTYTSAQNYVRLLTQGVTLTDSRKLNAEYKRNAIQSVRASSNPKGMLTIYKKLQEIVQGIDKKLSSVMFQRTVKETTTVSEAISHFGAFIRGLFGDAKIVSEVKGGWFLTHTITDTVQAAGTVIRGLLLFIRIVSGVFVRDYLLRRFLKARSELFLKSVISREITLDSRIG